MIAMSAMITVATVIVVVTLMAMAAPFILGMFRMISVVGLGWFSLTGVTRIGLAGRGMVH
jgi:hypothetical protein